MVSRDAVFSLKTGHDGVEDVGEEDDDEAEGEYEDEAEDAEGGVVFALDQLRGVSHTGC